MLVPEPFLQYVAHYIVKRLSQGHCEIKDPKAAVHALEQVLAADFRIEDEINDEARELLNQYADYIRTNEIPFHEMYNRVKKKILVERKYIAAASTESSDTRKSKIARDKITDLSHQLAAQLPRIPGLRVLKGWNNARLEITKDLNDVFSIEEQIDKKARDMISNQQRNIVEGGQEWNVLHRRYYEQEMQRLGVNMSPPEQAKA
jgi:hypothetical protein